MRKFGYVQQVIEDFFNNEDQMMVVSILPDTYARRYPSKYCAVCTNRSCYKEKDHD